MGLENFIPQIWSVKLFVRLRKALVFGNIVNTDYEGEITGAGDTVKINEIGPVTVSDYTKYSALTWQELTSAQKSLLIDQQKSFSFTIGAGPFLSSNHRLSLSNATRILASYLASAVPIASMNWPDHRSNSDCWTVSTKTVPPTLVYSSSETTKSSLSSRT